MVGAWNIEHMVEDDLAEVMDIEFSSFPDPWAPVAYAMELRHNGHAVYLVARDAEGRLGGYIGWWELPEAVSITQVAVAPSARRSGLGSELVNRACRAAVAAGKSSVQLVVRSSNAGAIAFYRAIGFKEVGETRSYYANPDEDGVIMAVSVLDGPVDVQAIAGRGREDDRRENQ